MTLPETQSIEPEGAELDESTGDEQDPLAELTGLVGRLNVIEDGQVHYFGSQSSYNLVREPIREADPHEPSLRLQRQGIAAAAQLGKLVTISDDMQNHLLDIYWRWQNPWNYVIHKGTFLRSFKGEDGGKYCSPLLLSAIFAISARYSDRPELRSDPNDPNTAGDAFCEHAKILLLYESEAPTITTVQAACLLALRIMSDGKEALGWLYSGNATRMAHNLGLNLDCSKFVTSGLLSEDEADTRKVTWWGCYVVDKLFSLGLGRPSSTPKSSITCPKPSIDNEEEYTPWKPTPGGAFDDSTLGVHSHISSTAHHVSETYTIACEAMDMIYAINSKLSPREIEDIVTKADVELQSHYRALPSYLRLPSSPKVPMLPHICLFHIQYHAHLILLHRPLMRKRKSRRSVSKSASSPEDTSSLADDEYANEHMATCRHSAAEIARLLRVYKQQYTLRRIPIAAVHLCFSAVIIHLIDARPSNPKRQLAIHHLQTCIDALRDLRTAWCAWSDRALRAIQLLAREWYHCDDVSQLQHVNNPNRGGAREAGYVSLGDLSMGAGGGAAGGQVMGPPVASPGATVESTMGNTGREQAVAEGDPLAFLFDASMPDQYTDTLVREWLAESGYDDMLNMGNQ
ncbi:Nitrogen assimilation transcription factor nit-4 [Colletotrichum siamense]|uniref:Nitrogen assimilation transcription factor nit-4 n=1 Tax=Colletotrichum siamense TaxID=690259 RepID=A0A9P5ETX8_COLSI|nr:Nitrogen assimilation transcription factor nit-4 [Colletotrichum siamense]KAF4844839.1 Nitrogen assimilation transcription factor nit-4 [Colletotrichum siamense]KAF4859890.1 Nitrogen assimilation transcription factor nit-4 [Colletotrichum siamense]KAF5500242.1 Nitrogen assimilation transcription factor nit-4 [Colletotrichum siamense]